MFFQNSLDFSMIQWMLAIWFLVPLSFLNPVWTSRNSWFTYYWSLLWRILSIILLRCEMSTIVLQFEDSLALPFFGIRMKMDIFQSCGQCWVFQICWHIECSTLTASSFKIWNSSTVIPSPPRALFIEASSPITSWQIDGETVETVADFIILGSKITADDNCSHEIKRHLFLGRKAIQKRS